MRSRAVVLSAAIALLAGGCSASDDGEPSVQRAAAPVVSAPGARLTVVADADPVDQALSTSRALFESAPAAVLAQADDRPGVLLGASAAVGLGVPLLLTPADGDGDGPAAELARLGARTVLAVGDAEGEGLDVEVRRVPTDAGRVADTAGLGFGERQEVPTDGDLAAVAALDADRPAALRPDDEGAPAPGDDVGALPAFDRPEPLRGAVVLAAADAVPAAVATARAAGARVQLVGADTDPRASAEVVELLADDPESVLALGAGFGAEPGLDWKVETAATGAQLPGGGQLLFPGRMLVALYGHPGTGALGVLGEQPVEAAIQRARDHAAPYEPLVDAEVVPAFEIIATVASSAAGGDGNYSAEADPEFLRPWVEAAGEAGVYVVLDLQPGRTDFVTQAERYRSLLELPHVGLALDPEWRLAPDQVHLTQIGSVPVEEVNAVVTWLADLTRAAALPQKLLVLHQFRTDMLPGRERLDTSRDELAVLIHADGQGSQGDKQATWARLHENPPAGITWGWKNFYDEDAPMLTPEQTVDQVDPVPELVSYQ
ncbi:hypothetical protein [Blastococcus sp. TF02A-30]|uniref:hypothetical protein n=1 Tax=Blastococcus sp. TF02A-30 TaxID=2250580 RepID=UPI000DE96778|nr:hypothetical protein [Blastococcus sp. TF02A-30]RBY84946.1 hypothetical protein DQ241_16710 [Blastococcus sp. TF02A-30]